jgi:outer membrane receptor protein involved in Fe transport
MNRNISSRSVTAFQLFLLPFAASATEAIDEIVVTADYRGRTASELPAAVSTLAGEQVAELANQHFEELINVFPNLNWSGDGHRARYLQIRGIGELEQYQGAPNPSVGFLIDDIDFSGIGTVATLFDIDRVEVLRGPQGSRYGANALGGLVYLQSTLPTAERNGVLRVGAADDNEVSAGIAFGGALDRDETALFRLSAHHLESDGFRDNSYLGREDTNGRDETSVRGRLSVQPSDSVALSVALLYTDVDNGYDAFALDNSYAVLSDKPGRDSQQSVGASLKVDWFLSGERQFTSLTSFADSDIEFGFDADWGNDDSWAPFVYDFVSVNDRSRRTFSQEFRLAHADGGATDWVVGAYALRLEDDLQSLNAGEYDDGTFPFVLNDPLGSEYEATSVALFGQLGREIGSASRLSGGLRIEHRTSDYRDTSGLVSGPTDDMIGGELTFSHDHSEDTMSFVSVSRGYKAGGFNLGFVPDDLREYRDETLWNVEAGVKSFWLRGKLNLNASVFYNQRIDQQVRLSFQLNPNDPASFGFATVNADGETTGLETELRWLPVDNVELYATLGLLDATIDRLELPGFTFESRGQAHAPDYTFAAGAQYRHPSGWFGRLDISGKDAFYFDVSHDERSQPYELVNLRLGYEADSWSAQLWVRNLFDEHYAVRGFFFGNEPPDFPPTLYIRLGDPRQVGLSFEKRFGS